MDWTSLVQAGLLQSSTAAAIPPTLSRETPDPITLWLFGASRITQPVPLLARFRFHFTAQKSRQHKLVSTQISMGPTDTDLCPKRLRG